MIENTAQALERAEAVLEKYAKTGNPRLGASASFRGLNNASDELIVGLDKLARRNTARCCRPTPAFPIRRTIPASPAAGMAEIERLEIARRHRRAHADRAFRLARAARRWRSWRRRKPSLVCAPSSSLHNGYGNFLFGKLPELMALGVNVAIGSDHASSGIVDMSQEMRLACCCYKETRRQPARHAAGDRPRNGDDQRRQGGADGRPARQHRGRQGGRHRAVRHPAAGMAAADQSGGEPGLQRHRRLGARRVRRRRAGGGRRQARPRSTRASSTTRFPSRWRASAGT